MGWYAGLFRAKQPTPGLLSLDEVLEALGDDGVDSRRAGVVRLADVVGSVNRAHDFDASFRVVNPALCERWSQVARALGSGRAMPPVALVQLGELYFVTDGHHRVSVACSQGSTTIAACVVRVCTVAFAVCRLRRPHLAAKRAEREFLDRVPLDPALRPDLWLDRPQDWSRLADAAERWILARRARGGRARDRRGLASAWWSEEVQPVVARARRTGTGRQRSDIEVYAAVTLGGPRPAR